MNIPFEIGQKVYIFSNFYGIPANRTSIFQKTENENNEFYLILDMEIEGIIIDKDGFSIGEDSVDGWSIFTYSDLDDNYSLKPCKVFHTEKECAEYLKSIGYLKFEVLEGRLVKGDK